MKYLAIIIALVLLLGVATPVMAMAEPDDVSLDDIQIFTNLINTGDFLAIVPYSIPFTTIPDDDISKTFIFRLLSPDGSTENGTALAYPKYDKGYGDGVVSFYFTSGMTWGEEYIFRVQENPAYYPSPQYWDFVIGDSNYTSDSDQQAALKAKIVDSATYLSPIFEYNLLSTSESGQTVLSLYGELYYLFAIPGLQSMCPDLFQVQLESPDYTKRTWSTTLADSLKTKYAGTIIEDFMTGFAGLFSMDTSPAMNFVSIILFISLILLATWKFKASMLAAFIDGYALLLLLMLNGFFSMILAGLAAFLSAAIGGVILFLNRS